MLARSASVCLEDGRGHRLVLVSCDLWSLPAGLADRAIELARADYGAKGLGREEVVVAATHTHHSLANLLLRARDLAPYPYYPHVIWTDETPTWDATPDRRLLPSVRIEVLDGDPDSAASWRQLRMDGAEVDDTGPAIVTTLVGTLLGKSRWIAIWLVDPCPELSGKTLRFRIEGISERFASRRFDMGQLLATQGLVEFRRP